jgi:hypothetical protein
MTHSEKRASPFVEAQLALFTGGIYGATHTLTGNLLMMSCRPFSTAANVSKAFVFVFPHTLHKVIH